MKTIDSIILSKFIIDKLDVVSHLKVQKLLYYINAWHMVYFNDPIIEDDFEAWVHGPVSRKVYSNLKDTSLLHKKMRISDVKKGKYIERVERTLEKEQIELFK